MTQKPPFSGDGFSNGELSEEERSQLREVLYRLPGVWATVTGLDDLSKGGQRLAKLLGVAAAIGATIAYAVKQGWFG